MKRSFQVPSRVNRAAIATLLLALAVPGCGDGDTTTGTGGAGGTGASGGSGGSGASGATGGSGGSGGTGGGAAVTCLPQDSHAALFTIAATDLCAIAVYTSTAMIAYQQPTWGDHGGPLLMEAGPGEGEVTLLRWSPPNGTAGEMTLAKTTVAAKIPAGAFAGVEALDLGFRAGTAFSYSGAFPDTKGELIVAADASTDERYAVNGLFSIATLPAPGEGKGGRVLYTGLSTLGTEAAGANALYAADDCSGTFVPAGEPTCEAPLEVAAWGDASGPIAVDRQGNAFVLMTSFGGDQSARAFASSVIDLGSGPVEGDDLFTLPGFGQSLAAITPEGDAPGIVAFQPADGTTFEALDVLQSRYSVANDSITTAGAPEPLFALTTPNTPLAMLTDPLDHLWVGVPSADGTTTTFVVIARKPQ